MSTTKNTYPKWIGAAFLLLGLLPFSLLTIYDHIVFTPMIGFGPNRSLWLGIGLVAVGLLLPILGRGRRQHQRWDTVQDFMLALIYIVVGIVVFARGWKLDPILQIATLLLVESTIYWVVKDLFYRP